MKGGNKNVLKLVGVVGFGTLLVFVVLSVMFLIVTVVSSNEDEPSDETTQDMTSSDEETTYQAVQTYIFNLLTLNDFSTVTGS